jgi:hypothetical protein
MNVRKEDGKIIFEFPAEHPRYNPYMADEDQHLLGEMPYFTGLITHHKGESDYDEVGFAGTIDMSYAGKDDQVSDFIVMWDKDIESFKKKCAELEIDVQEMTFE